VESLMKPAQFKNLFEANRIESIVDIELIEKNNKQLYLYVLHQSHFDRTVGTITRQPICSLSIFEFEFENQNKTNLLHLKTLDKLSFYSRKIIPSTENDGKHLYIYKYRFRVYSNNLWDLLGKSRNKQGYIHQNFSNSIVYGITGYPSIC
jgi:hypothetical protein